ncbi:MAG: hypothetical protein RIT81_22085 [Deltaproteobacteria bacterium]
MKPYWSRDLNDFDYDTGAAGKNQVEPTRPRWEDSSTWEFRVRMQASFEGVASAGTPVKTGHKFYTKDKKRWGVVKIALKGVCLYRGYVIIPKGTFLDIEFDTGHIVKFRGPEIWQIDKFLELITLPEDPDVIQRLRSNDADRDYRKFLKEQKERNDYGAWQLEAVRELERDDEPNATPG